MPTSGKKASNGCHKACGSHSKSFFQMPTVMVQSLEDLAGGIFLNNTGSWHHHGACGSSSDLAAFAMSTSGLKAWNACGSHSKPSFQTPMLLVGSLEDLVVKFLESKGS
jgi:hypothetical protein